MSTQLPVTATAGDVRKPQRSMRSTPAADTEEQKGLSANLTKQSSNGDVKQVQQHQVRTRSKCFPFKSVPQTDPGVAPDGGCTAWLQVLAGHLICFVTWGLITSFGEFQSHYEAALMRSPSEVSWIGTIQIFSLLLVGTFSGKASDAGLVHEAVLVGTTLIVFGTFMTSLATQYWQIFLAQGVCVGLGMGITYMPGLSVPSSYFKHKKPFAVAVIASGAGSGGLVYVAMIQQLLPAVGEFQVP